MTPASSSKRPPVDPPPPGQRRSGSYGAGTGTAAMVRSRLPDQVTRPLPAPAERQVPPRGSGRAERDTRQHNHHSLPALLLLTTVFTRHLAHQRSPVNPICPVPSPRTPFRSSCASGSKFGDGGGDVLQGGPRLGGGESLDGLQSLVAMVTAQVHR